MNTLTLFDEKIPPNNSPVQVVDITTTMLYFSTQELKEFKILCKEGMKKMYGEDFQTKGNMPDLILNILREKYGNTGNNS